jgi:plastocyanin
MEFNFSPATISIKAGTAVKWTNTGSVSHSVAADDGSFDSGAIGGSMPDPYYPDQMTSGGNYQRVFATQGSIAYHCTVHPTMKGTITVTP